MGFLVKMTHGSDMKNYNEVAALGRIGLVTVFEKDAQKLSYSAFVELNQQLLQAFYEVHTDRRWLGFRVCAVDALP